MYHRYVETSFWRGEDYNPIPYYGYVDHCCGFTIRALSQYGVFQFAQPALAATGLPFEECFHTTIKSRDYWGVALAIAVRERLLFSLLDITGLLLGTAGQRPLIAERNDAGYRSMLQENPEAFPTNRGVVFGSYLNTLADLRDYQEYWPCIRRVPPALRERDRTASCVTLSGFANGARQHDLLKRCERVRVPWLHRGESG